MIEKESEEDGTSRGVCNKVSYPRFESKNRTSGDVRKGTGGKNSYSRLFVVDQHAQKHSDKICTIFLRPVRQASEKTKIK